MKIIKSGLFRVCFLTNYHVELLYMHLIMGNMIIKYITIYIMNIRTFVVNHALLSQNHALLSQNPQLDFPKMREGVNGRLELFRKFIRFGRAKLPLGWEQVI